MVDWSKKRTWKEKILVDFALHRQKKLLSRWNQAKLTKKLNSTEIPLKSDGEPYLSVTCIGNSFLPTVSRWTSSDVREKLIQPTFARIEYHFLSNLFPSFTFSAHTVLHYNWIAKDYPELFASIQAFQREEIWEITGGSWVNHNWAAVSGNSIIHQFLLGQRFYAKHFQQVTSMGWMDDLEEIPVNTPQFLQKSGITALYCSSDPPSSQTGLEIFPLLHWMWQAPDGTRIPVSRSARCGDFFSHLPDFSRTSLGISPDSPNILFCYPFISDKEEHHFSKELIPLLASPFGGSGKAFGLSSDAIMEKSLWEEAGYIRLGTAQSYFTKLAMYESKLPIWADQVFLRSGGFDLTVVGTMKENNHTAEVLITQAEALSVISGLLGGDHQQDEFTRDWETVLAYQDSHIFTGTTIMEVYRGAIQKYQSIFAHLGSCQENSIMFATHLLKTNIKNDSYTVFNGLGWSRGGYATILRSNYNYARSATNSSLMVQAVSFSPYVSNRESHLGIQLPAGSDLLLNSSVNSKIPISQPTQPSVPASSFDSENIFDMEFDLPLFDEGSELSKPGANQPIDSPAEPKITPEDKLLVYIPPNEPVPSFGISSIAFGKTSVPSNSTDFVEGCSETPVEWVFTNSGLCLKISKVSGNIIHFSLNPSTINLLGVSGIGYSIHSISPQILPRKSLSVEAIEVIERGPLRFTFLITYRPTKRCSVISTRISIYHQSHKIYGETLVDLKDANFLLALNVDTQFSPKELYCGGPYCVHKRSLPMTTPFLQPIVEFPFQEFVYWSSEERNVERYDTVAVYFQTKFGMSVADTIPRFHLVASKPLLKPEITVNFPDSDVKTRNDISDQGFQRIPWAIEFLPSPTPVSTIMHQASEFNTPFILAPTHAVHQTQSFFCLDSPNVMLVSVKEIEEFMREAPDWFYKPSMAELAFIIQFVEVDGIETSCSLQIDPSINLKKAMEVDFIERISHNGIKSSDVRLTSHTVKFTIRPHEIKSIMIVGRIVLEQE